MDSDLATPHPPGSTPQAQPWLPAESRALFTNNAFLVDGGMVTLVADCEPQLPMLAQGPRFISTAGLTVLGTQDLGEETFEVAFQGLGFPESSVGKASACNAGDPSSIPGSGRSTGEGHQAEPTQRT